MSPRSRDRILNNLESIYREAYARAKDAQDETRMADLDASYQREQLILEVLLDVRDGLLTLQPSATDSALEKMSALRKLAKLR